MAEVSESIGVVGYFRCCSDSDDDDVSAFSPAKPKTV